MMAWLGAPAHAAVQEVRVVAVGIDDISVKAEENAMDYARKRAVYLTARKLGGADAGFRASKLKEDQLSQIIRGTKLLQTRREGNTTYAEVNVTLVEDVLRKILNIPSNVVAPVATTAKVRGVLVLPVFVGEDRPYLWEQENQLRAPLAEEVLRQSHGAVLVAGGDFEDLRLVDYKNILTVKADELKPMFARYGSREIIVAVLTLSPQGKEAPSSVLFRRLSPTAVANNEVIEIPPVTTDEKNESRLRHVVVATATALTQIASSTAEVDQEKLAKATKIKVRFTYATSRELGQMQQAVRTSKGVLALEIPNISLKEISGTIYFDGAQNVLQELLKKQNIIIRESADGWIVSLR